MGFLANRTIPLNRKIKNRQMGKLFFYKPLGAIIRGATLHFDLLAHETSKNLSQINLEYQIPIGFGTLTADTLEQAIERAGTKAGNKGAKAAAASLEMGQVVKQLSMLTD